MPSTPSTSLIANLRAELMRTAPFAQMEPAHVDRFIAAAQQAYYAPGETVLAPDDGVARQLLLIRQGRVTGRRGADESSPGTQYEAGDLFPVGAVMGARAVTATYRASEDTFCLILPVEKAHALAADSAPFADFLNRRVLKLLDESRQALQSSYASQALAEQSLETPLGTIARLAPVSVTAQTPLAEALALMHARRIGSLLVLDGQGVAVGILTRHDILGRVTLPQLPLATPIAQVMSAPVHTLGTAHTAQDAALLMSRHGVRHVPVTDGARVVGIVSERDLFALQRLSLKQVSTALRHASDLATLRELAGEIRRLARNLLGQGVRARQLTELISHLNDLLTERLVALVAARHGLDLQRACWLGFGSEGRSEQTISTDQDNGLVFESDDAARDRPAWLAFAREVNEGLDACGYPLCKGNVMASNPACCLTPGEWSDRFADWMEHGAPEDLLNASIYFDLRPLAGNAALAEPLRALITREAARLPRFMHQMALNALARRPPLNWLGGLDTQSIDDRDVVDLKLQGTAIFVDAARLYALVHGVAATNTRARLEAAGRAIGIEPQESEASIAAFEFLQLLRLQVQIDTASREAVASADGNPNRVDVGALNDIDRRMLRESLRIARRLQQRMELDYRR
jgi:CBS domain-containing protein